MVTPPCASPHLHTTLDREWTDRTLPQFVIEIGLESSSLDLDAPALIAVVEIEGVDRQPTNVEPSNRRIGISTATARRKVRAIVFVSRDGDETMVDRDLVESQPPCKGRQWQSYGHGVGGEEGIVTVADCCQTNVGQHHATRGEVVLQVVSGEVEIESAFQLADRP